MAQEIKTLEDNDNWLLVHIPKDKHCIGYKWTFKFDGLVDIYKTQLVDKGCTKHTRIDFSDTFSPMTKLL